MSLTRWWNEDVGPNEKPGLRMLAYILMAVLALGIAARMFSHFAA
ncbi:hypothetical protein WNY37_01225 [Henriciella sp. AS95]